MSAQIAPFSAKYKSGGFYNVRFYQTRLFFGGLPPRLSPAGDTLDQRPANMSPRVILLLPVLRRRASAGFAVAGSAAPVAPVV